MSEPVRTIPGRAYGAQDEREDADIAAHVTIRIPQALMALIRRRMRLTKAHRTTVILTALERGLR